MTAPDVLVAGAVACVLAMIIGFWPPAPPRPGAEAPERAGPGALEAARKRHPSARCPLRPGRVIGGVGALPVDGEPLDTMEALVLALLAEDGGLPPGWDVAIEAETYGGRDVTP